MSTSPELNVSLEPHLVEKLVRLDSLLPAELAAELKPYIDNPSQRPATIPYSLLSSVSQWSRSSSGQSALQSTTPATNTHDYSMISLLAGVVTSPERHFPQHVPKHILAEEERKRQITDKKAIATLLNAMLSIVGTGFATWMAAERWKNEWRVLLSFIAAVVVAVSETILYIIWQSRRSGRRTTPTRRPNSAQRRQSDEDKEQPKGDVGASALSSHDEHAAGLRLRRTKTGGRVTSATPEHSHDERSRK